MGTIGLTNELRIRIATKLKAIYCMHIYKNVLISASLWSINADGWIEISYIYVDVKIMFKID